MFHDGPGCDMLMRSVSFALRLCTRRVKGTKKNRDWMFGMFHDMFGMLCFTICLFISPDLDGQRAPKCYVFTICLFNSPDLDGQRAPKIRH
jgi:hypothetical protein